MCRLDSSETHSSTSNLECDAFFGEHKMSWRENPCTTNCLREEVEIKYAGTITNLS